MVRNLWRTFSFINLNNNKLINQNQPMKFAFKIVFLLSTICFTSCKQSDKNPADISYEVTANLNDSTNLLVKFNYKSDVNGELLLKYENTSWGDTDIYNCISSFKVDPEPTSVVFDRDSSLVRIKTTPNQINEIQYTITQDFKEPLQNYHRYRPIINKDYFHTLGMRLFMFPVDLFATEASKASIAISWGEMPNNGLFHSSFGYEREQLIKVTQEDLYASFFIGGDFRRYQFESNTRPVYFVTRGDWKTIKDDRLFSLLKETISFQDKFWNDPRKEMYSVSLIPTFETWTKTSKSNSLGGSCLTNSFISFASNNDGTTLNRLSWLYNHELLHTWIGRTILNEDEVKQYWFSEGFTDYYAYKLMLKNDNLSSEEFIDILNKEVITPHYKDEINSIPNSELTFNTYWSNYKRYQKLPYRRGLLYAFLIDTQIKQQSNFEKSLDHLMLDFFQLALDDESMRLNNKVFKSHLSNYLSSEALFDFEQYIIKGQLIDFRGKLPKGLTIDYVENIPLFKIESSANIEQLGLHLKQ